MDWGVGRRGFGRGFRIDGEEVRAVASAGVQCFAAEAVCQEVPRHAAKGPRRGGEGVGRSPKP